MATTPSNTMTHLIQILNVTYKQYDVILNQYLYYITGAHCQIDISFVHINFMFMLIYYYSIVCTFLTCHICLFRCMRNKFWYVCNVREQWYEYVLFYRINDSKLYVHNTFWVRVFVLVLVKCPIIIVHVHCKRIKIYFAYTSDNYRIDEAMALWNRTGRS
jgi:hypothetical protein